MKNRPFRGGECRSWENMAGIVPIRLRRSIAVLLLITFGISQSASATELRELTVSSPQSSKEISVETASAPSEVRTPDLVAVSSTDFLQDTLTMNKVSSEEDDQIEESLKPQLNDSLSQKNNDYEYERYDFSDAFELLRPEFASAMVLKDLKAEDLKALGDIGFETGILVLHGEIVLFTSGSEDEVGVLPAVQALTEKATLISHTHPNIYSTEGPSGQDINEAVEAPDQEYVITHNGVYAYNNQGVLNDGNPYSYDWYLERLNQALVASKEDQNQVEARKDLNQFIAEQDEYNQASEDERVTLRRGGTLSYTSGLKSSNVTTLSGSPYPYIASGSSSATTLSVSSNQFMLGYSVPGATDISGFTISFDNASTAAVETQNISTISNLTFGLRGPTTSLKFEVIDFNNNKDTFTLTNISNSKEQFWRVPVSSISNTLDKTKIKQLNFVVEQVNTTASTRTGTLYIRSSGLNTNAPAQPVVTSSVPAATNQTALTLSGTKEANTSILINGVQVVASDSSTNWSATVNLTTEGNNTFNITAKNSISKVSTAESVSITRDTVLPTGSMDINSGDLYAASQTVTLNLSASDERSGIEKMGFSTDNVNWSSPEVYASSKSFNLPSGEGNKIVYVKYYDKAGNVSSVYSKAIILDTVAPAGSITVNNSAQYISQTSVTLNLSATDAGSGLDQMSFSSDNVTYTAAEAYAATKSWTFSTGDGNKTVYVKYLDKSGKWSSPVSATVFLDTTAPAGSIVINGGAESTDSLEAVLSLMASDNNGSGIDQMRFSTGSGETWGDWETFSGTKTFTLPEGQGTKTVFYQLRDHAGNTGTFSASIEYLENYEQVLEDGTRLFFESGIRRREMTPDNAEIFYRADGSLEKYRYADGSEIVYQENGTIERKDFAGTVIETIDRPVAPAIDLSQALRMNLADGLEAYYVNGTAVEFKTKNGLRITNFTLDTEQNITDALMTYPDGTREIIRKGVLLRRVAVNGSITDYTPKKFTVREIFEDHTDQYIYQKISQTKISGLKIQSSTGAVSEYDELGILRKVSDGQGKIYQYTRTQNGEDFATSLEIAVSSEPEEKTLLGGTYDAEGALKELRLNNGQTLQFENGQLKKVTDAEGQEVSYSYEDTQGIFSGLQVTRQGTQFQYNAQGFLETLSTDQGTITRTLSDDQTVQILLDEVGGNTLSDFELDSEGKIIRGIITTKEGIKQRIENGALTGFETVDGRVYEMQGSEAVLTEWKFKDGTRVVYGGASITEILYPDGKRLHQIGFDAQKKIQTFTEELPDGTKKFFSVIANDSGTNQQTIRMTRLITSTGAVIHYGIDGLAQEVVLPDTSAHRVVYTRDAEGQVASITFEGEDAYRTFAPSGEIMKLLEDGVNTEIENGEITKLYTRFGSIEAPSFDAQGGMSGEVSFVDGTKLTIVNGELTQAVRPNGTKIIYTAGRVSRIEAGDAKFEMIYVDGTEQLEAAMLRVTRNNQTAEYELIAYLVDLRHYFPGKTEEEIARLPENEAAEILLGRPLYNALEQGENQTFLDARSSGHAFTVTGDAQIGTAQPKLGEGSLKLDGSGDSLQIQHQPDLELGASDWTVDFWVMFDAQTQEYVLFKKGDHLTGGIQINRHAGINRWDIFTSGDTNMSVYTNLASGVWHHIALVRDGGTLRFFENGVQKSAVAIRNSGMITNTDPIYLGMHPSSIQSLPGQLDELRVSKTARWTSNFTVSAQEYAHDANTVLLLHFNQNEWSRKSEILPEDPNFTGTPVYFTKLLEDTERGSMAELNSYYFPAWMNLQKTAADYNGGFISRNVTMDSWGTWAYLPGETADILDMNGDGLPDRVYIDPNPNVGYWWVQYNNGIGFDSAEQWTGVNQSLLGSGYAMTGGALRFYESRNPHVLGDLTDINGDGLPDRVMQKNDGTKEWYVQLNNGHGFDDIFIWANNTHPVSQFSLLANYAQEVRNSEGGKNTQELIADLIDMDGDGLKDRIVRPAAPPFDRWFFQKNNGNGFDDAVTWQGVSLAFDVDPAIAGSMSWQFFQGSDEMGELSMLVDMNGDGRPDRVLTKNKNPNDSNSALEWHVQLNNGAGFDAPVLWSSNVRVASGSPSAKMGTSLRYINNANYKRWIFTDLRDVTGDGLPDRITIDRDGTDGPARTWWVEVNTGSGFASAAEWTGIYGANGAETAISQDQDDFRANRPYDRTPPYVEKVADLVDMNGDGILDRVIFPKNTNQWLVQFGTGSGFLPVQAMQMKGLASSTADILSSRYDYLHVSLKAAENLPSSAGRVKVSLGSPLQPASYQEWFIDNLTTAWKDIYLPINKTKGNASSVKVEFNPASGTNTIAVYADNVTFTDFRPNAAKDWLDRMLTEENVITEVHSDRTQTLASYLGLREAADAAVFNWDQLLSAETKIRFNETGEADQFETFYGSVSKIEDGKVTETTLPDGSKVVFDTNTQNSQQTTQIVTNTDGTTQSFSLNYGRVRQVSREGKSPLQYAYEFDVNGNEITVVSDPDTGIAERYREVVVAGQKSTQLISRAQTNGVITIFTYDGSGQLIRSEMTYKGRIQQTLEHGTAQSGNTTLTTEDGTIEEYGANGVILFHTTSEGYKYKHTFERAKQAVTTFLDETLTLDDGSTLVFQVPFTELVDDPQGEEIHRVELIGYEQPGTGTKVVYENGALNSLTLNDRNRIAFTLVERNEITDPETEDTSVTKTLLDVKVDHPDGTVTEFKNGKPFAVVSATGRRLSLAVDVNLSASGEAALVNDAESAAFHYAQALKLWNETVMPRWNEFQAPASLPVTMEYSKAEGKLLAREFAEGVVELYENGKIEQILSPDGEVLIKYSYDNEGNPMRIEMGGARRRLESAVKKLQAEVAVEREKALAHVADRESVLNQTIEGQYVVTRDRLLAIRAQIEAEQNKIASISVKGKAARAAIGDAMGQIQAGIDQVNSALSLLASERSNALAQLSTQVAQANTQIETESAEAYQRIQNENTKALVSILKQEISPVVYHWFRKILGRDPSQAEYDRWIEAANVIGAESQVPGTISPWLLDLKNELSTSTELADRTAQVNAIKASVREKLTQYLAMSDADKLAFAKSLGLAAADLLPGNLTSAEAAAILDWLDGRSLHFGQSAFLALESILPEPGAGRIDFATDLILMDILMAVITPAETGDLVISMRAMNLYAQKHGIAGVNVYAMSFDALKALYDSEALVTPGSVRIIAHIDGNHYVIITKVTDTEVTYIDPGAGPENALDLRVLSKSEFLKTWGVDKTHPGFGYVLSARPPPAAVPSAAYEALSTERQMKVRGAFFGFISKIFKAIWEFVVNTVKAIVTFVVEVVKGVVDAIIHTIQGFGNLFTGLFTGDFSRALKGLYQIFIQPGADIAGGIMTGFIEGAYQHVGTLEALGFSERTARKIIATQIAGVEIIGGVALTAVPGAQPLGISLIMKGTVDILNTHTQLSPTITNIIGLTAAAVGVFAGSGFDAGSLSGAISGFKSALPFLSKEFASAGVMALGSSLGMSWRLVDLINVPVRAFVGGLFPGSPGSIEFPPDCGPENPNCIPELGEPQQSPWSVFFKWIAGQVIQRIPDFFGGSSTQGGSGTPGGDPDNPPPSNDQTKKISEVASEPRQLQNMDVELTQSVEKQLEQKYDINGALDEARQTAAKLIPQGDASSLANYGQYIQQNGIAKALDDHALSFFKQSSIEKMVAGSPNGTVQGFVNQQIAEGGLSDVVDSSGRGLKRLALTNDLIVEYDPNTLDIVNIREGNFGVSYQDLRYNGGLNQPQLVNGDIVRLNPANNVRVSTSITNGRITQVTFSDSQGQLAKMIPADGKSFITSQNNVFLDYRLQEFRPPAEFRVEGGFIKDVRYTITQNLEINGNNIPIDILLEKINEGNPILKAIGHNLEQLDLRGSQLDTVLRVIADHFENKLKSDGKIWVDENGQIRLNGLTDVFDFDVDKITKDGIIQKLDIPADRILNAQDDLVDYSRQLIQSEADELIAEQDIARIRADLGNQNLPAILETSHAEFTAITSSGDKQFETSVSSGVIFRGDGSFQIGDMAKPDQGEIFVDKDGKVYYSDTILNDKGTFYTQKNFFNADGSPVSEGIPPSMKDTYQNGQVFEINTTKLVKLEDGSIIQQPEKIRIEVANVAGSNDMAVIVRKESGNFYTESVTKITPIDPSTNDEEFEQAVRGTNILESLVDAIVSFGQSILDVHSLLRNFLI